MRGSRRLSKRLLPGFAIGLGLIAAGLAGGCGGDDAPFQPVNKPPAIEPQPDTRGVVGDTLHLVARASDPDGDALAYSLAVVVTLEDIRKGYRCHAHLDPATGEFWFVPGSLDVPHRGFWFVAKDGRGGADTTRFAISSN